MWPEHIAAVEAFILCSSQLRITIDHTGRQIFQGLDYAGARAGLDALQIEVTPELWQQIMIIETGAKLAWNERQ